MAFAKLKKKVSPAGNRLNRTNTNTPAKVWLYERWGKEERQPRLTRHPVHRTPYTTTHCRSTPPAWRIATAVFEINKQIRSDSDSDTDSNPYSLSRVYPVGGNKQQQNIIPILDKTPPSPSWGYQAEDWGASAPFGWSSAAWQLSPPHRSAIPAMWIMAIWKVSCFSIQSSFCNSNRQLAIKNIYINKYIMELKLLYNR